jgi:hypothetical protein
MASLILKELSGTFLRSFAAVDSKGLIRGPKITHF